MSFQLIHTFHKREKVAKREKYSYYCVNFFQDDTGHYVAYPLYTRWGIDTTRIHMADGCGLSHDDLVSPMTTVSVLKAMYHGKYFQTFYESLPIAGVDGTLRNRMKGTAAENNVHAKTGTIEHVSSISGYVTDADGEMFVFSMMVNHYTVPASLAEKEEDEICERLASFSSKGATSTK